jgi:iron complex outermembrane receptor protein
MLNLLLALAVAAPSLPSEVGVLNGHVRGPDGAPITGARVTVVETRRTTLTDAEGRYTLTDLPNGSFRVTFAAVGFAPQLHAITLTDDPLTVDVVLKASLVELSDIQVTAGPSGTDPLSSPQPTSAVDGEELRRAQAPSLGDVVSSLVGVRALSTGNAIAKPVIRGLSSSRVLILDDGQRVESQGWGDEHAPNVETADAERVEVIRGPASVLYGSEALGGVVNVIQRPLPDAIGRASFVGGTLSAGFATNGTAPDGTLGLQGGAGAFGFRGSVTGRTSDDVSTPGGDLSNTGYDMLGGSVAGGLKGSWGSLSLGYTRRDETVRIHEDPAEDPGATPWQDISDQRWRLQSTLPIRQSHVDIDIGAERNDRKEYEAADVPASDVALGLQQWNYLGTLQWHHRPLGGFTGILGGQFRAEEVDISGEETLVPAHTADNAGIYLFEEKALGRFHLSVGARYDRRTLDVETNADLGVTAQTRKYDAVTGSLGLLYRVSGPVALVANVGRGFRAPSAFELFANGVHEGTVRYELGDSTLDTETSLNTDLALRVQTSQLAFEVGAFLNTIDNYIYSDPTGAVDPGSGFQVYQNTQGNARLAGAEAAVEWHPTAHWHLKSGVDYTHADNTTTDTPLPSIPPLRWTWEVRYEAPEGGVFGAPYLSLSGATNATQTRLDPDDIPTEGYSLATLGAGVMLFNASHPVSLDLQVKNLFDTEYRDFLSRYKGYADDPGRNLIVRMATTF